MFEYKEHKIISAMPLDDIKSYLCEIGGIEKLKQHQDEQLGDAKCCELNYEYLGLEIKIHIENGDLAKLNIPKHTISVQGDKPTAEKFLTDFRFRFMSAGG